MKVITSGHKNFDSIGYYLTLRTGTDSKYHIHVRKLGLCRAKVEVIAPKTDSETLISGLTKVIHTLQRGCAWPVRFDWDNVCQYLTLTQFHCLDSLLGDIPICLYNYYGDEDIRRKMEIDDLIRKVKSKQIRQYREERRSRK